MNKKEIFTAGIFFIGFLSLLLVAFNALLTPIREDIVQLNGRMDRLETEIKTVRTELTAEIRELRQLIITALMDKENPAQPVQATKDKQAKIE